MENRYSGILPGEGYIGIRVLADFLFAFKIPNNGHFSICLPSEHQLRELISIMSSEWLEELELFSDVIRLDTRPITIRCAYDSDQFDALYNPVVGINIMSEALQLNYLENWS